MQIGLLPSTALGSRARRGRAFIAGMASEGHSAAGFSWDRWVGGERKLSPSAERNKQPILDELRKHMPDEGLVLEVASGTGQHVAHLAAALPAGLRWQPSDVTNELFGSIAAWAGQLGNVAQPVVLDAASPPDRWPVQGPCAAVLACNVTHIAPCLQGVTQGLVAGAGALLRPGGLLAIYGAVQNWRGVPSESNRDFHESLVGTDPSWGYRDAGDVAGLAAAAGLGAAGVVPMPANNFMLLFRKPE